MLDRDALREEHESGELDERPRRVQALRAEFDEHLDKEVPRSLAAVPEWYTNHKGSITTMLSESEDEESEEAPGDDEADEDEEDTDT